MANPLLLGASLKLGSLPKPNKAPLNYVVAVDSSKCARQAFLWADFISNKDDRIAIIHSAEKELQLKCVMERYSKYPKEDPRRYELTILEDENLNLEGRIKHFVNAGQKQQVDMLVTGLWGDGFEDEQKKDHIGTTADLSLRSARCSSLFVRPDIHIPENQNDLKIVVGVDGSQNSLHAFEIAIRILAPNNHVFVVHVKTKYDAEHSEDIPDDYLSDNVLKNYTKRIADAKKELGFKVTMKMEVIENTVLIAEALCQYATDRGSHILCVGADGMTAFCSNKPILGSVSDDCVKHCKCNLIVTQINEVHDTPRKSLQNVLKH